LGLAIHINIETIGEWVLILNGRFIKKKFHAATTILMLELAGEVRTSSL